MYNPGRKNKKIQIWGIVDSYITLSQLETMSLEEIQELADNSNIGYNSDRTKDELLKYLFYKTQELWFYPQSEFEVMTFDQLKMLADGRKIAFDVDVTQPDLINLILADQLNWSIQEFDRLGQPVKKDKCIKSLMAEIIPQTGSLMASRPADTILSKTTHKIKVWYNPHFAIKAKENWIIYKDHRFEIDYILNPNFANEDLEIFCQEI